MNLFKRCYAINAFMMPQFPSQDLFQYFIVGLQKSQLLEFIKKSLKRVYSNEKISSLTNYLKKDKTITVHQSNLQMVNSSDAESFKAKDKFLSQIVTEIFSLRNLTEKS